MSDLTSRYTGALMNTFGPPKLALVRGEGTHVWDEDGKEYVDLLAGIAVNSLGHGHPALVGAVTEQLQTLGHVSNFFTTGPQVELAERLLALVGGAVSELGGGKVFFANSGAEANEGAFKLTRRTGRTHVVVAEGGFHGRTMGALALTSKAAYREPFEPLPGDVTFVPYGDADALIATLYDELTHARPGWGFLMEEAGEIEGEPGKPRFIIDPLDGTREFSEPPRDDWAVHVALSSGGTLIAGAVAQPALGETFNTGDAPVVPPRTSEKPRIAVSRSRPPAFVQALAEEMGAELVPMGSAGVKMMSVVRDVADAYVHAGGQYEWDSAAPVAVARAAGLFTSRVNGDELVYNQDDVYLPDLIVCRPELSEQILAFIAEHGTD